MSGVVVVLVAMFLYRSFVPPPPQINSNDVSTAIAQAMASATPPPAYSASVYQIIQPSLVVVQPLAPGAHMNTFNPTGRGVGFEDVLTSFRKIAAGDDVGGGVIVDDSGDILTSLHVIASAGSIEVTFADGTQTTAQVTGTQPDNDIAVLSPSKLPTEFVPATLGNPNAMRVGDEAYVVGSPFDLYNSMSAGVISGLERSFQVTDANLTLQHLIQVDAAANPGNAGGPLLNRAGQVVGIVTVLLNPTGQNVFIGIAFAVPITIAGGAAGAPPV